ncbi:DUF4192 family protein [Microbacterium sp. JZ31]|uniref:DUF4192 family protein n=1 Tax=Microbacterium sp. JZ31 TaxID=1906274 RepID=UPI00193137F7|nr:DUF4192 family protein [Microbacterium sp. JZ31]
MTVPTPASEPAVIRAGDNAEFLSLVPHLVGCRPRDSVVMIPFADRRTLGGMRIDLPPADAADVGALAAGFLGSFARVRHANRIAVVVYTDDAYRDERGRIARSAFVDALLGCARASDYAVVEALCVASDGWGSYLEPDGPYAGSPLDEIRPEDVDLGDGAPLADQGAGLELPATEDDEREAVARAIRERATLRLSDPTLTAAFEDVVAVHAELAADTLALLVMALDRPAIRDVALSQWSGDLAEGREIQRFNIAWAAGEAWDFDGPLRLAGEGARPDAARLRRALEVARKVAAVAPRRLRTGALASAAWLSWALGSSTHAAHYVRLAQEINPAHGLADIVATMVRHQHLPAWAYERPVPGPPPANRAECRRRARRG